MACDPFLEYLTDEERKQGHSMPSEDLTNPAYYKDLDPEPIKIIEKWGLGYHLGQVVKYVARAGKKVVDGDARKSRLLDLRKARWYLDREIARMEGGQA